jgi:hypothetical protein
LRSDSCRQPAQLNENNNALVGIEDALKTLAMRLNAMKTTLLVFFILFASLAWGQVGGGVLSNQAQILELPEHPQHAAIHEMAPEQPLVGGSPSTYTYARGERPLWEFGPVSDPIPLGDVARAYRKQKLTAKKAEIIFEKQGS